MKVFETEHAIELKRFPKLKRSNDVFFEQNEIRSHNYSGFEADHVIALQSTAAEEENSAEDHEDINNEEDRVDEEYEDGFYDDAEDSMVQNETVVAPDSAYYESDEGPDENDSTECSTVVGIFTKVEVVPPDEIRRKTRRWKKTKTKRMNQIDERLIQPIPENICTICKRVFRHVSNKRLHEGKCKGNKDPQDIISFAVLQADRLIRNGDVQFIQNASAMNELSSSEHAYQTFQVGWALRPRNGELYGKITKYSQEVVVMFTAGVENIAES